MTPYQTTIFILQLISSLIRFVDVDAGKPWEPEPRENNTYWTKKHKHFLEIAKNNTENPVKIIFYGDSLTDLWNHPAFGKSVWDTNYANIGAVNFGIGGDRTEHVLWRILHGEVEGCHPKVVVLLIGVNNFFNKNNGSDIFKGIQKIITTLQEKLPNTKILLVGLLPGLNNDLAFKLIADINLRLFRLDNKSSVRFLDMWYHFAEYWPKVVTELYSKDRMHISAAGYQKWSDTMTPLLTEMLK